MQGRGGGGCVSPGSTGRAHKCGGGGLKAAVYGRISARCRYPSYYECCNRQ